MRLPWVSRETYDALKAEKAEADRRAENWHIESSQNAALIDGWGTRYDALMEKYHELARPRAPEPAPAPAPLVVPQPDQPPDLVLNAIQQISPIRDKTYEANWQYWERNKIRAALHPEAFADEIIAGAVWEPEQQTTIVIMPEGGLPIT